MRLKATIEVKIDIKKGESFETANERLLQELMDVVDDWINYDGMSPCIRVAYEVERDVIKDIKDLN